MLRAMIRAVSPTPLIMALVVSIASASAVMAGDPLSTVKLGKYTYGPVERVVDGDSFIFDGRRIRLWGIDAPENDTPEGLAATSFLRELVAGEDISCTYGGIGPYGRTIAQCWVGGVYDIAWILVRNGFAVDWPEYSKGYYGR